MSQTRVRSTAEQVREAARAIRRRNIEMVHNAGLGHIGGDLSAADILSTI
jgi:transketolase